MKQCLQAENRMTIAASLCKAAIDSTLNPVPSDTLYRTHPSLTHLKPHQAAVFQELIAWRHDHAKAKNQPVRSILNDGQITELSKRQPITIDGLKLDRRMPKRIISTYGDELITLIQRAQARPEWAWPRYVARHTDSWLQRNLLETFLMLDGNQHNYSPRLVFSSAEIDALVLDGPKDMTDLAKKISPESFQLAGIRLWQFLDGKQSLSYLTQNKKPL